MNYSMAAPQATLTQYYQLFLGHYWQDGLCCSKQTGHGDAIHGATNGASGRGTILVQTCSFNVPFSVIPSDYLKIQNEATKLTASGYV